MSSSMVSALKVPEGTAGGSAMDCQDPDIFTIPSIVMHVRRRFTYGSLLVSRGSSWSNWCCAASYFIVKPGGPSAALRARSIPRRPASFWQERGPLSGPQPNHDQKHLQ